jgi:demethylmenaquinone methyltransferase/2-methoxy-6-polyprenyl-1,4-benzoquinol methylase/phosphoethanolamine N-methyltransferase
MTEAHSDQHPHTPGKLIRWAFLYDVLMGALTLGHEARLREITLDLVGLQAGEKVLDVGCGTGSLAIAARRRVGPSGTVAGIDPAPEMVARARMKAARVGADVRFETAVIESLPFGSSEFDVVLSSLMIHHLPKRIRPAAFAEVHRVLKPNGRFLAVDFKPPTAGPGRFLFLTAHGLGHGMAHNDIRLNIPALETAGFCVQSEGPTRSWMLSYILLGKAPAAA